MLSIEQQIDSEEDSDEVKLAQDFAESLVITSNSKKLIAHSTPIIVSNSIESEINEFIENEVHYAPPNFAYLKDVKLDKPMLRQINDKNTSILVDVYRLPKDSIIILDQQLGSGAFGKVFLGKWGEKLVALKEIDIFQAQKTLDISAEAAEEALKWEIARLATTSHSNLIQFYGTYQHRAINFIVMEYCENGNLEKILQKQQVPWHTKWQWALEITQGLSYLHKQGIIHRDLKAENILLDRNNRAKLADLGVAQVDALLEHKEADVVAQGFQDQKFISPETRLQRLTTPLSDIYALGLVFWQLATNGKNPSDLSGLSLEILTDRHWEEHEVIPEDCPIEFGQMILSCWQLNPDMRPDSAKIIDQLYKIGSRINPMSYWIRLCEETDIEINFIRKEHHKYIPSYVTEYQIFEDLDSYWLDLEKTSDSKLGEAFIELENISNLPLKLEQVLNNFLEISEPATMLLLGEAGLGKTLSIYRLADELLSKWWSYLNNPRGLTPYFPVFIRSKLNKWSHSQLRNAMKKYLDEINLDESVAKNIKWLIIIDGYDECQIDIEVKNLPEFIGLKDLANTKLLVACRPNIVQASELQNRFAFNEKLIVRYFLTFNIAQMFGYLKNNLNWDDITHEYYFKSLKRARELRTVLRNPFVLNLLVQSWATISKKDFSKLSRWQIYQDFVKHWVNTQYKLLNPGVLNELTSELSILDSFNNFAAEIAFSSFQQKSIVLNTDTAELSLNSKKWVNLSKLVEEDCKKLFALREKQNEHKGRVLLSEENYIIIMKLCLSQFESNLPLKKKSSIFEFTHKSFFEYFIAKRIIDLHKKEKVQIKEEGTLLLNYRQIQSEPESLRFISDAWQEINTNNLKKSFLQIIASSKQEPYIFQASANAITILNVGKVSFSGMDFKGIRIPGADLTSAILDHTDLEGADLTNVNLRSACLYNANLRESNMVGAFFGESAYLDLPDSVSFCAYSSNGNYFATISGKVINIYKPKESYDCLSFETTLREHTDFIWSMAFSPNSLWLASGGRDNTVILWSLSDPVDSKKLHGHTNDINSVLFSQDNKWLASGSSDSTVRLWDISDLDKSPEILSGHGGDITSMAFSRDNRWLASGSTDCTVCLWDISDLTKRPEILKIHKGIIYSIAVSTNSKWLASGSSDKTVCIWNLDDLTTKILSNHQEAVNLLDFSPDNKWLASASYDKTVILWSMLDLDKEPKILEDHSDVILSIVFSSDSQWLAYGSNDNTICIWNLKDLTKYQTLFGHGYSVNIITFSPDNTWLVSGSSDKTVRFWRILADNVRYNENLNSHTSDVVSVAFSYDGRWLASGSFDNTICIWDLNVNKNKILKQHSDYVRCISFSPDNQWLASCSDDETICLWDLADLSNEPKTLKDPDSDSRNNYIMSVDFSGDNKFLVSGSGDKKICIWNLCSLSKIYTLLGHTDYIRTVAFSRNSQWLASGADDKTVRLWSLKTCIKPVRSHVLIGHTEFIRKVVFSYDGEWLASASDDKTVRLWNINSSVISDAQILDNHSDLVHSITFSYDNKWLASGSSDKTIIIWGMDVASNTWQKKLVRQTNFCIYALAYSFDASGLCLATGGGDYSVCFWEQHDDKILLIWNTKQTKLYSDKSDINNAKISTNSAKLLKQRGSSGEPIIQDEFLSASSQLRKDKTLLFYGPDTNAVTRQLEDLKIKDSELKEEKIMEENTKLSSSIVNLHI